MSAQLPGVAEAFPDLHDTIYMNTASTAAGSAPTIEALSEALTEWAEGRFDWVRAELAGSDARVLFAELIRAPVDTVALIPAVSAVAGLVANHLALHHKGGNVVVGASEFTSNLFAWRQLADHGYEVRLVPFADGRVSADSFASRADESTRLIAVSSVQSSSGYRADLAALREIADRSDAILFVDASQSVGALSLDVSELGIDALATCSHKFLLGTRGMGYGCFRPDLRDAMSPVFPGWAASVDPMKSFYGPDMALSTTASRFDLSTPWFNALAERASLRLLRDIGFDTVHRHNEVLSGHMRVALTDMGIPFRDHGADHGSTVFSLAPTVDDVPSRLAEIDVVASERAGRVRLSLHLYNTTDQIDSVVAVLTE